MASYDFSSDVGFPIDITLDTTIVDTSVGAGVLFLFSHGDTSVVQLTEGDEPDLSDGSAVDPNYLSGATTFTTSGVSKLGYVGHKRYVKINITNPVANTSTLALLGMLHYAPQEAL